MKSKLIKAILELENLLEIGEKYENCYQNWFEQNSIVFTILGYKNFYAFTKASGKKLPKDESNGLQPEPDFIVQREDNGLFEIFEIKTPVLKNLIIDKNQYRINFTAKFNNYISQTITYEQYFTRNPANRQKIKELYDIDIQPVVDIKIVIGRNEYIDKSQIHQHARRFVYKIDILTYDDILNMLNNYYFAHYGIYEDIPGFSFHFVVRFKNGDKGRRNYFFDLGMYSDRNRISFYLDEMNDFCFEVKDGRGKEYKVRVDKDGTNLFEQWIYLVCEFGKRSSEDFCISASINGLEKWWIVIKDAPIDLSATLKNAFLGCDLNKRNFTRFDQAEQIAYSRTLKFKEKIQLLGYVNRKYQYLKLVEHYVEFDGSRFMYRDVDSGHFIQTESPFKPIYRIVAS